MHWNELILPAKLVPGDKRPLLKSVACPADGVCLAGGAFKLGGQQYQAPKNDGPNSLHGGSVGFNKRVWDAKEVKSPDGPALELHYLSPDGEEGYDNNGNRSATTSPTSYSFSYDDENRLTSMNSGVSWRSDFLYDGLGRLRRRTDLSWTGTSWTPSGGAQYIYDGNRVIQERNTTSGTPTVAYTRGTDLSGSLEGAGGIGGLESLGRAILSMKSESCRSAGDPSSPAAGADTSGFGEVPLRIEGWPGRSFSHSVHNCSPMRRLTGFRCSLSASR